MCGRYALNTTATELIEHFQLLSCPEFGVRFNIAPASIIPIIRYKPDAGRVGQLVKWGLVPSWAKDPSIGAKLNNARGETVAEKPSFKSSFARHRCLIPASGFYEWQTVAGKKQPFYIHPTNGLFAFAGLLAAWNAPDGQTLVLRLPMASAPTGTALLRVPLPAGLRRYFRIVWRVGTAALTAGKFSAYVSNTVQRNTPRTSGFWVV